MSFSYEVKEELARHMPGVRHCRLAELAAIINLCGKVTVTSKGSLLCIQTENYLAANKCSRLLWETFQIQPQVLIRSHRGKKRQSRYYVLQIRDIASAKRVLQALKLEGRTGKLESVVNGLLLQSSCCKRAFLRGVFLCSGSVSDPNKSYHLEMVCASMPQAEQLKELLRAFDVEAKGIKRKNSLVVYIKESNQIVDVLNIIQASRALMDYENSRIKREIKGNINRQVNCETANISKTISAAHEQLQDIRLISSTRGLSSLSRELEETARVRLEYPDYTLKELGAMMNPPVGKSGVNHRLRKIK